MASFTSDPDSPFTIYNLPYGVITSTENKNKRCATTLGSFAVDLSVLYADGIFAGVPGLDENLFAREYLNAFAALPKASRKLARERLTEYLSGEEAHAYPAFIPLNEIENHFPMDTRNFSDFYCSLEHTKNDGVISPNWFNAPMVYNGRTSSLVVSGTPVHRPYGIFPHPRAEKRQPMFQPETHMDFELEMGVFLSEGLSRGQRLRIGESSDKVFGFVLLNDWSARQIQLFEMAPLGPFHSKGSATSISPWIVTVEALEASICARHADQEVEPLPHLRYPHEARATFDIELSAKIIRDDVSYTICETNLKELYWTPFQQLTHLASAGEGLAAGDLFGTGTISSDVREKTGLGCLFERTSPSNYLSSAPKDVAESFLKDGDRVVIEGWCREPETGKKLFGFGTCEGELLRPVEE
ncbi:hypothetical protein M406DRAFT_263748 [Cryphonectria parasitica EP155]|uniref:Fumarylacetoacetase n=1 Tax=Cryphonectria parasitica (strain ATCC 38755 / EP155) TaxID=660469 RepID=A0A9P4XXC6_CRYP1|nr:uncharacterized protein M406DRAFT_263748 [Cryphonectria parasitica EP155]KAF3762631.1 hypothetical protein M406DRAFT_263748 [Cryphonectria parasitica EP155]